MRDRPLAGLGTGPSMELPCHCSGKAAAISAFPHALPAMHEPTRRSCQPFELLPWVLALLDLGALLGLCALLDLCALPGKPRLRR